MHVPLKNISEGDGKVVIKSEAVGAGQAPRGSAKLSGTPRAPWKVPLYLPIRLQFHVKTET